MASKLQQSQQSTTTAVATTNDRAAQVHKMLVTRTPQLAALLGGEKMAEAFTRAAASFYLRAAADPHTKIGEIDLHSFVVACMDAAVDKLLPDGRDGWIVVRKGVAAWTISWRGLVKLARRASKSFRDFAAEVVYREEIAAGAFRVDLASRSIAHTPWYMLGIDREPGEESIVLAYAIVTVTDDEGFTSREFAVLTEDEIIKRARMSGNPYDDMPSQAWAKWFRSMAKKAAIRTLMDRIAAPDAVFEALRADDARVIDARESPRPIAALTMASDLAGSVRAQISAGHIGGHSATAASAGAPVDPNDPDPHGVQGEG